MYDEIYVKVCEKGHKITYTSSSPAGEKELCHCGAKVISFCPECEEKIPTPNPLRRSFDTAHYKLPVKCENCGENFPWKKYNVIQNIKQKRIILFKYNF